MAHFNKNNPVFHQGSGVRIRTGNLVIMNFLSWPLRQGYQPPNQKERYPTRGLQCLLYFTTNFRNLFLWEKVSLGMSTFYFLFCEIRFPIPANTRNSPHPFDSIEPNFVKWKSPVLCHHWLWVCCCCCCLIMSRFGGSSGLVVSADDSCSKGRGFESQCCILDGHLDIFSHWFVVKIVFFEKTENKWKRGWGCPFFLKKKSLFGLSTILIISPLTPGAPY